MEIKRSAPGPHDRLISLSFHFIFSVERHSLFLPACSLSKLHTMSN